MHDPPLKSVAPEAPPIEIGVLAGRDGVTFGPGIILQGNLGRLGLYGWKCCNFDGVLEIGPMTTPTSRS
jgi:hypothetical protein